MEKKKILKLGSEMVVIPFEGGPINPTESGPISKVKNPKCEHCGRPLDHLFVKTETVFTFCPDMGEYQNIEKNWDYHGDTYAVCSVCSKITYSVTFTEDGRLVPKEAEPYTCEQCGVNIPAAEGQNQTDMVLCEACAALPSADPEEGA